MNSQYTITDRLKPADIDAIQALLKDTYWASERTRSEVEESLRHSVIVVARGPDHQLVGCARAVTDTCTFAWICDVVVAPGHRRRGLGKALVERLLAHLDVTRTRKVLVTKDAQGLYRKFGFERHPSECMIKYPDKPRPAQ
jgi:N-acetylglutamate synthase-like GNAT family acetyltransferase